uniref:Tubulin epsilon and delta complex protein 2 n=1 Tax=Anas zonorhyncha TaxID=75864 RepID=A0A8B9UCI7_9AVES
MEAQAGCCLASESRIVGCCGSELRPVGDGHNSLVVADFAEIHSLPTPGAQTASGGRLGRCWWQPRTLCHQFSFTDIKTRRGASSPGSTSAGGAPTAPGFLSTGACSYGAAGEPRTPHAGHSALRGEDPSGSLQTPESSALRAGRAGPWRPGAGGAAGPPRSPWAALRGLGPPFPGSPRPRTGPGGAGRSWASPAERGHAACGLREAVSGCGRARGWVVAEAGADGPGWALQAGGGAGGGAGRRSGAAEGAGAAGGQEPGPPAAVSAAPSPAGAPGSPRSPRAEAPGGAGSGQGVCGNAVCSVCTPPCRAGQDDEQPETEASSKDGCESRPSPKELEELELLNRALEKALRVRKSISKTPVEAQVAPAEKPAGEGSAFENAQEQQVPVSGRDMPVSREARAVSKKPASLKKPSPYQLRAPYRTDPDVKKTQRRAPARCVSQGPRTAGKSSSKGVASRQGRSHRPASSANDQGVCAATELRNAPGSSKSALKEQQSSIRDSSGEGNLVAAGRQLIDAGKKSCGSHGESSRKENPTAEGGSTLPRTVTVQQQGCQLKLPHPYRKAYSRNCRAWERSRLCQTSADAAAARKRFTERIQTTFCSPMPALSPAEIEEELKVLQDVPSLLRQYVEAEPADHPTLQREYESLLTLEGLQSTVSQCLRKLQLLQAAVEAQKRLHPDCTGDVGSCCPACVPARGRACGGAGTLAVPLLWYSSFQELRDLFALKLQVSMLHQEIALQKVSL